MMIELRSNISIPEASLEFRFSRSSGPGGQNVNKLNTRVAVFFDVANCDSLSDWQKKRILTRLATRSNKAGVLRVVCQKYRTQKANKRTVIDRLAQLLTEALTAKPIRKKTKLPLSAKIRRLEEKKHKSQLKKLRSKNITDLDL